MKGDLKLEETTMVVKKMRKRNMEEEGEGCVGSLWRKREKIWLFKMVFLFFFTFFLKAIPHVIF